MQSLGGGGCGCNGSVQQGYVIPDTAGSPFAVETDDCFKEVGKCQDLVFMQGASFEIRVCLADKPYGIRCIEASGNLTLPTETCLKDGDNVEVSCISDCAYDSVEGEYTVDTVSADRLTVTLDPVPTDFLAEQRCFTASAPVIGCLSVESEALPQIVKIHESENITFHGGISYNLPRREKDFGINTIGGSQYLQTTVLNLVKVGDRITIPGANLENAEIINVERLSMNGQTVDVVEIDQTPNQSGCYAATIAPGTSVRFDVRADGECVIFSLTPNQTSRMLPFCMEETDCGMMGILGYYSLNATAVVVDGTQVFPITTTLMQGRVLIQSNQLAALGVR